MSFKKVTQQEILDKLAHDLKSFRRESGMTQREVAEKVGVKTHAVSVWERGAAYPYIKQMTALINLYKANGFYIGSMEQEVDEYYEEYAERRRTKHYAQLVKQACVDFPFLKPKDIRKEYVPGPNFFGNHGENL